MYEPVHWMLVFITLASSQVLHLQLESKYMLRPIFRHQSKEDGNDQELMQSSTTPDPGYHMEK